MSNFTVGKLENMLRKFDKETSVHVACRRCCSGSMNEDVIKIDDRTNQTYGYIELELNGTWDRSKELSKDKTAYYEKVIADLTAERDEYKRKAEGYESLLESVKGTLERNLVWINRG